MLKVENLSKIYFDTLFEKVTFLLGNREKVGLIGLNGCGKTTLLKIISGKIKPDSGKVDLVNERIGYLSQEFSFKKDELVGEFLEKLVEDPYREKYKVDITMHKLSYGNYDEFQYIQNLSEGQKMKLKLAELLLKESTILLLDEPTNHLDIEGIIWFEDFIRGFDGVCIIISHDREFLNNITNKIFEIDEKRLYIFEGNYDDYLVQKEKQLEERTKHFKLQESKRERLERLIDNSHKIANGKKRGKAIRAAKKRLFREVVKNEISDYKEQRLKQFSFSGSLHRKKKVVGVNNLSFGYNKDKVIFQDVNFNVYGKERIWFYGANGIGKTTFVKLLIGVLKPLKGEIKWGENISWTYFSQDQKHIDMDATVENYFIRNTGIPFENSFGVLERFLFSKDLRNYKLKLLSPGQRARLSFAVFSMHNFNFLILDEPTNHLDIRTKEVIEEALLNFDGAIFVISHDRYFIREIGIDRAVTIENLKII